MAQSTTGWRALLSMPGLYKFCMNLLGSVNSRRTFIETYVRPYPGIRILDIGCGPATILDYLPEETTYVGVDISQAYIEDAQAKYGNRGKFYCLPLESISDVGLNRYDLVIGVGVLHHLNDTQGQNFFSIASNTLKYNGRCVVLDPCIVDNQHPIARFLISMDRGRNIRTADAYAALAKSTFPNIVQHLHYDRLRVPYTHHILECWHQQ
jgi:cyclopropane fatty-acyl-phospholipid synthase-like methyltransferase